MTRAFWCLDFNFSQSALVKHLAMPSIDLGADKLAAKSAARTQGMLELFSLKSR